MLELTFLAGSTPSNSSLGISLIPVSKGKEFCPGFTLVKLSTLDDKFSISFNISR